MNTLEKPTTPLPVLPLEGGEVGGDGRDLYLREMLGMDYEFARNSGLIDTFYYDPDTGRDGIRHILTGEKTVSDTGEVLAEGFHHEPSAHIMDESAVLPDSNAMVDRTHLENANSRKRREFSEPIFEPYKARVTLDGKPKVSMRQDAEGNIDITEAKNSMYPKEYDPLAVLQAIRLAYDTRDPSYDVIEDGGDGKVLVNDEAHVAMLDGTSMNVRLVMDGDSQKILTAIPMVHPPGQMKLSEEQATKLLID